MTSRHRVAIMQPYFLPYIGYWQLMRHVDLFVIYDDVQYTKKGWINRNRFLQNDAPAFFTLPLAHDSDYLNISQRCLSATFRQDSGRLFRQLHSAYQRAPFRDEGLALLEEIMNADCMNLFEFIFRSVMIMRRALHIETPIRVSSTLDCAHGKTGQDRVIEICREVGASHYLNPVGGQALYDARDFRKHGIVLQFQRVRPMTYTQYHGDFVPDLSIVDQIMFVGLSGARQHLLEMDVVEACVK